MNEPSQEDHAVAASDVAHIRARPGMYIGGTSSAGLHQMVWQIARSAAMERDARGHQICVTIERDGTCTLAIAGSLPGLRPVERALPLAHVPDFQLDLAIASAVCERLELEVTDGDRRWRQVFIRGFAMAPAQGLPVDREAGVVVRLLPDPTLFPPDARAFDRHWLAGRLRDMAVCRRGLRASVIDLKSDARMDFHYDRLESFLAELEPRAYDARMQRPTYRCATDASPDAAELTIFSRQYGPPVLITFFNGERCTGGGSHVDGLREAMAKVIREVPPPFEHWDSATRRRPLRGQTVILSVWLAEPEWYSGLKERVAGRRAHDLVHDMVVDQLPGQRRAYFQQREAAARAYSEQLEAAAQARMSGKG